VSSDRGELAMRDVLCGQVIQEEDGDWCYSVLEPMSPDPYCSEIWIDTNDNSEYFKTEAAARADMVEFVHECNEMKSLFEALNIKEN
jgi:hypothetical protein